MLAAGVDCSWVIRDPSVQTALAVLPIFASGERGCFVNLAANDHLLGDELAAALREVSAMDGPPLAAFHYGYPHFTKQVCVGLCGCMHVCGGTLDILLGRPRAHS